MRRMQAAGIDAFGGEVQLLELAAPASPAPDEVVISVRAAGVGNWDEIVREIGRAHLNSSHAGLSRMPSSA